MRDFWKEFLSAESPTDISIIVSDMNHCLCKQEKEIDNLKKQLEITEEQNKRVLEKLTLIIADNQHLQQLENKHLSPDEEYSYKKQIKILEQSLILACEELEDAIEMLRSVNQYDLANLLNDSPDYFKAVVVENKLYE